MGRPGQARRLLSSPGVRKSSLSLFLVAGLAALAAPARAQSQPVVEPIAAPAPAVVGPAPVASPQVADDEAPHAHRAVETETLGRDAPALAEPESSQLAVGLALGLLTVIGAVKVGLATGGDRGLWYAGAVLGGGAVATGAIVCAFGQKSPTRHGGCRASIAGALLGAVGALPGLALLKWQASRPCTATGPNDDDACATGAAVDAILDLALAGGGYMLGTAYGARFGWELGATSRFVAAPPAANVSLLSLQF
ncbi:MAG TPA: hypothetical protein VLC06_22735 [Polyangia bacterium]|nr:hypothetical protein [Polyangia bacterium]